MCKVILRVAQNQTVPSGLNHGVLAERYSKSKAFLRSCRHLPPLRAEMSIICSQDSGHEEASNVKLFCPFQGLCDITCQGYPSDRTGDSTACDGVEDRSAHYIACALSMAWQGICPPIVNSTFNFIRTCTSYFLDRSMEAQSSSTAVGHCVRESKWTMERLHSWGARPVCVNAFVFP